MRAALYARVSSDKQDVDLSISAQLRALRDYADKNGYEVAREFVDEAESGRTVNRPVFQEMIRLARVRPPPFQAILVWKLSRFARNREDSIIYKSLLRKHGVQVISINEPVENSPTGRMMEGIIEVLDEFYSANLAQEVTRGMREAAARGFWVSAHSPYGYRRVKVQDGSRSRTKLEPYDGAAGVVRRLYELADSGMGCKEIATRLNAEGIPSPKGKAWGKGRVHAVLTNEVYTGTAVWGRQGDYHRESGLEPVRVEGAFPALIDRATFDRVQAFLRSRGPKVVAPRRVSSPYLLSGLLHCGRCGAAMFGHAAKSGRYHYYVCATAHRNGTNLCDTNPVPRATMEERVLERLQTLVLREEHLEELVRLTNDELEASLGNVRARMGTFDGQIADVDRRLERHYDALESGKLDIDMLAPRISALKEKRDLLQRACKGRSNNGPVRRSRALRSGA